MNKLAGELGELFRLVGEPSPWAASSSVGAKHGSAVENDQDEEEWWDLMGPARGEGSTRRSIRGFDMSAVDSKLFERQIERTSRLRSSEQMSHLEHQRYNAYTYMQKKAQREGWDLALGRSSSSSGGKRDQTAGQSADFNLDSDSELEPAPEPVMRRPARIGSRQAILQAEIDSYLRSPGRVLLRGMRPHL